MMRPKIALIGPRSTTNLIFGMSTGFDLLISACQKRGIDAVIIDRSHGIEGRRVGGLSIRGVYETLRQLRCYWQKLSSVTVVYITIGTSHAGFLRDMLMIWLAWLYRRRIVLHMKGGGFLEFHDSSSRFFRSLMRLTFSKANTIIVLGELLREQFEFIPGIEAKIKVVPNGLPDGLRIERVQPKSLPFGLPIRLLYLSNMIPSKGYMHVLEACRILLQRKVPFRCDFCGAFMETINDRYGITPAQAESQFRSTAKSWHLESMVKYHGTVQGHQKQELLEKAHFFLLPTAYPWEGQPISIIEALAFATPVITTPYRGIPEQVVDNYNGIWVDFGNPRQMAYSIERLIHSPNLYREFSRNALHHFRLNFTQDAHLDNLIPTILGQDD